MEDSKEDKIIKAGFMMVKKELEVKTGRMPKKEKKKIVNQEDLLKKIKKEKIINSEINFDIYELDRMRKYKNEIDPNLALKVIKEKLWVKSKDLEIINLAMVCYMKLENYEKALVEYKKGMYIDSKDNNLNYNYIELKLIQGEIEEAYKLLIKKTNKKIELEDLYLLGIVLYLKNQEKEALDKIVLALKKDTDYNRVYKFYTFISLLKGDRKKAKISLEKLLEKNIDEMSARILLNDLNLADNGKVQENLIDDKYMSCILVNKAKYLIEQKDYEEADKKIREALIYNPKCICAKIEKSRLYIEQSRYEEIFEEIESTLKYDNTFLPLLNEILKIAYYLRKDELIKKLVTIILSRNVNLEMLIYTKEKKIAKIRVKDIQNNFPGKLHMLLDKYKDLKPEFSLVLKNEMEIYQLFRDIKMCEIKGLKK